jgi:hypothetical protein
VASTEELNLPDILGYITGDVRAALDVVQCALAVNPQQTPAGQSCKALLVVQSVADCEVDLRVQLLLPTKDAAGAKGRFFTQSNRVLLGMHAAEVGVVTLPLSCSPRTAQAIDYRLGVELKVERRGRRPQRVRDHDGGGPFDAADLSDQAAARIEELRRLRYSAERDRGDRLVAHFDVIAPTGPSVGLDLAAGWESLWTMRDYVDERVVIEKMHDRADQVLPSLRRNRVLIPLMKTAQECFGNAGYPLHPGEALCVAKLLTLVLESGVSSNPDVPMPRWYVRLCRLLLTDDRAAHNLEHLVTNLIWRDLIVDATVLGFNMVGTVTRQQFGGDDELQAYAQDLAGRLLGEGQPIDFTRAYLPLVMGGLVANTRVTMPREAVRDSVDLLGKAREQRQAEMNDGNREVFTLIDLLLNRALDMF